MNVVGCVLLLNALALLNGASRSALVDAVFASTNAGPVKGRQVVALSRFVNEFLGIPFAEPPVGSLRFKDPQPVRSWGSSAISLDATKLPNSCVQLTDPYFGGFRGAEGWNPNTPLSEDCLYLNVWSPTNASKAAVVVWIYGGGFYSGSSTLTVYDGRNLAAVNDIVVVSFQYRVHALGFASLGIEELRGNVGMLDQVMALRWVQENIASFGGDPNNVTIMGESAGAASVSLHLFSPLSRGKFHRAIMQSGFATADWVTLPQEEARRRTLLLAKKCGCPVDVSLQKVAECLQTADAKLIQNSWVTNGINQFPHVPVVDGRFLMDSPKKLLLSGEVSKVPVLMGFNANEATYFLIYFMQKYFNHTEEVKTRISESDFQELMSHLFWYYPKYPQRLSDIGQEAILFHYKNWEEPTNGSMNRHQMDQAVGDWQFTCPLLHGAQKMAQLGVPVYVYSFTHRSSRNPWPQWMGVMHADEINFVFGEPLQVNLNYQPVEVELSHLMMRLWTNFAKYGDPNGMPGSGYTRVWPEYAAKRAYLELNAKFVQKATSGILYAPKAASCQFWTEYLPRLMESTSDISEAESDWRQQFYEWKNKYIVDWKLQYDKFVRSMSVNKDFC